MREPEDEDEDDQESVLEFPVVDKTFNRLVKYIYDQYPDSRPHSDPSVPSCCNLNRILLLRILRPSAFHECAGTLGYKRSRL